MKAKIVAMEKGNFVSIDLYPEDLEDKEMLNELFSGGFGSLMRDPNTFRLVKYLKPRDPHAD